MNHQGTTIEKKQVQHNPENGEVVKKETVLTTPSDKDTSLARVERFTVIGNWTIGAISAILGGRFLLNLLGANPSAGFTKLIAAISEPLVMPFHALFSSPAFGQSLIDSAALVGLVVYPVAGYGFIRLARAILAPADPQGAAYQS